MKNVEVGPQTQAAQAAYQAARNQALALIAERKKADIDSMVKAVLAESSKGETITIFGHSFTRNPTGNLSKNG